MRTTRDTVPAYIPLLVLLLSGLLTAAALPREPVEQAPMAQPLARTRLGYRGPVRAVSIRRAGWTNRFGDWIRQPWRITLERWFNRKGQLSRTLDQDAGAAWPTNGTAASAAVSMEGFRSTSTREGQPTGLLIVNRDGSTNEQTVFSTNGSLSTWFYYATNGDARYWERDHYRQDGSLRSHSRYGQDGTLILHRQYDRQGRLRQALLRDEGGLPLRVQLRYDTNNRIIDRSEYRESAIQSRIRRSYGSTNRQGIRSRYNSDGILQLRTVWEYRSRGGLRTVTRYNSEGKVLRRTAFHYDRSGKLRRRDTHNGEGKLLSQTRYRYDWRGRPWEWERRRNNLSIREQRQEMGRLRVRNVFQNGKPIWQVVYHYNQQGQMLDATAYHAEKQPAWRTMFRYDKRGNLIRETVFQPRQGRPQVMDVARQRVYRYQYDRQGNWVRRTQYARYPRFGSMQLDPRETIERHIIYFRHGLRSVPGGGD